MPQSQEGARQLWQTPAHCSADDSGAGLKDGDLLALKGHDPMRGQGGAGCVALTESKAGSSSSCSHRSCPSARRVYKGLSVAWVCSGEGGAGGSNLFREASLALV